VSDAIERDFQTMVWVTHVASQLFPSIRSLRLEDTLKQFAAPLHEQVGRGGEGRRAEGGGRKEDGREDHKGHVLFRVSTTQARGPLGAPCLLTPQVDTSDGFPSVLLDAVLCVHVIPVLS
jgi:hypothetical protein